MGRGGGGGGGGVCELPMYLQQNMYSQSIIFFSYVCRCGAFIFNQMVMTLFITHIYGKNFFFLYTREF